MAPLSHSLSRTLEWERVRRILRILRPKSLQAQSSPSPHPTLSPVQGARGMKKCSPHSIPKEPELHAVAVSGARVEAGGWEMPPVRRIGEALGLEREAGEAAI